MTVGLDSDTDTAASIAVQSGIDRPGGRILILCGTPFVARGAANLLHSAGASA